MKMIQITEEEYKKLKKLEEIDFDLIRQFASSLQDFKNGRFKVLA
jgi:ABC-type oligopeptide transport system substrate-binding subunit